MLDINSGVAELQLSHFRCFKSASIHAQGRSVVLTGANGSGKTSILEAVSFFSPGRGMRRVAAEQIAKRPEGVGWKVSGRFRTEIGSTDISTWWTSGPGRKLEIGGQGARQSDLGRVVRMLWLNPAMDRLWSDGADGRRKFLDRMALSLFPDHAEISLGYDRAMRERNRLLRGQVSDTGWYEAVESRMAVFGAKVSQRRLETIDRLRIAFGQSESAFPTAGIELISREGTCAESCDADEIAAALSASRMKDGLAGRSLSGPHRVDMQVTCSAREMAAKQCSTGEQKALLISMVLANTRAIAEDFGTAPVLLLDEIAAHLDADRLKQMFEELAQLNSQIWMSGTDSDLFREMLGGALHLTVQSDETGSTLQIA